MPPHLFSAQHNVAYIGKRLSRISGGFVAEFAETLRRICGECDIQDDVNLKCKVTMGCLHVGKPNQVEAATRMDIDSEVCIGHWIWKCLLLDEHHNECVWPSRSFFTSLRHGESHLRSLAEHFTLASNRQWCNR